MNPNATPENIEAAQRVVQEQAEAAGRDIENRRIANLSGRQRQTAAALETVLNVVDEARRNLAAGGFPVLRAKVVVIEVQEQDDGKGTKTSETLTMRAVYDGSEENKSFSQATPSLQLDIHINNPAAFGVLKEGAEIYLDFTPAQTPAPVTVVSSQGGHGAGSGKVGNGDEALANLKAAEAAGSKEGTKPITATTGSQGTNDQSAKLAPAPGGLVDPNDPNAPNAAGAAARLAGNSEAQSREN